MKNFFKYMFVGTFSMIMSVSAFAAEPIESNSLIYVNGKVVSEASAKVIDGYTVVPIRFIADRLSCDVKWNDGDKSVTVVDRDKVLTLTVGSKEIYVSGEKIEIPTAPIVSEDRVYVPLRAIADGLDIDITWNEMTKTVSLYSATAAKVQFNDDYSEAPEAALGTVYLSSGDKIILPVNCDPNKKIEMSIGKEEVCTAKLGYMDGKTAIFIEAEGKGTTGITLNYPNYSSSGYYKTTIDVRVVNKNDTALTNFDSMLVEKEYHYKDIYKELEDGQSEVENNNGLFIYDRNNEEYEKLYVGDTGMLVIPIDYNANSSGEFNVSYDFDSSIECKWGMYEGKNALMVTSSNYAYIPVRITFTENTSGTVNFTTTDKDMAAEETPIVFSYGNNKVNSAKWDFYIRSISDNSTDLDVKLSLVKDRISYIE